MVARANFDERMYRNRDRKREFYVEQRRRAVRQAAKRLKTVDFVDLTSADNPRDTNTHRRSHESHESTRRPDRNTRIHYQSTSSRYSAPADCNRDQTAEITINLNNSSLANNVRTSIRVASHGGSCRDISVSVQNNDRRDSTAGDLSNPRRSQQARRVLNEIPIVINGSSDEEASRANKRRSEHVNREETFITSSTERGSPQKRAKSNTDKGVRELDCPICFVDLLDNNVKSMVTPCGHLFCLECLRTMSNNAVMRCSICRVPIQFRSCTLVHL